MIEKIRKFIGRRFRQKKGIELKCARCRYFIEALENKTRKGAKAFVKAVEKCMEDLSKEKNKLNFCPFFPMFLYCEELFLQDSLLR